MISLFLFSDANNLSLFLCSGGCSLHNEQAIVNSFEGYFTVAVGHTQPEEENFRPFFEEPVPEKFFGFCRVCRGKMVFRIIGDHIEGVIELQIACIDREMIKRGVIYKYILMDTEGRAFFCICNCLN